MTKNTFCYSFIAKTITFKKKIMLSTIVIIQEKELSEQIQGILQNLPSFKEHMVCRSLFEAKILIKKYSFDILIIESNQDSNIDWIKNNCKNNIEIIFIDKNRIFENQFLDLQLSGYINSKLTDTLLSSSLKRAKKKISERKNNEVHINNLYKIVSQRANARIALSVNEITEIVNSEDIISISTNKNYCEVYLTNDKILKVKKTLAEFELLLQKLNFFKIHPSHIINIYHLKEYSRTRGGNIKMSNSRVLPLSSSKRAGLKREISKINLF